MGAGRERESLEGRERSRSRADVKRRNTAGYHRAQGFPDATMEAYMYCLAARTQVGSRHGF